MLNMLRFQVLCKIYWRTMLKLLCFPSPLPPSPPPPILYIKATVVSACVDKNWAVPGRFFQSLPIPCGVFWGVGEGKAR